MLSSQEIMQKLLSGVLPNVESPFEIVLEAKNDQFTKQNFFPHRLNMKVKKVTLFQTKVVKIDSLFQTKTAKKPYPLAPHLPI